MIYKDQEYPVMIHPMNIEELTFVHHDASSVQFGASTPISVIEEYLKKIKHSVEDYKKPILESILNMTEKFAGKQIKNVAVCIFAEQQFG